MDFMFDPESAPNGCSNVTSICSSCVDTISKHNLSNSKFNSKSRVGSTINYCLSASLDSQGRVGCISSDAALETLSEETRKKVLIAEKDFKGYLTEKRRVNLTNLIKALCIGADSVYDEERNKLQTDYHTNFLPTLIQVFSSMVLHSAEMVLDRCSEERSALDVTLHHGAKNELETSMLSLVHKFKATILAYLEQKQAALTLCALDALSISVLDREDYWKEKTKRDLEKLHTLKLQEVYNDVDRVTPSSAHSDEFHFSPEKRRTGASGLDDISLSMWIGGVNSPGNNALRASERHRSILVHSPSPVPKGRLKANQATVSPPTREGHIRIRDINSSNILHDNIVDAAPVALGVGGHPLREQTETLYANDSCVVTPSHSAEEYFQHAHRIRGRIIDKAEIIFHEVEKSLFLDPNEDDDESEDASACEDDAHVASLNPGARSPLKGRRGSAEKRVSALGRLSDEYIDFLRGEYNDSMDFTPGATRSLPSVIRDKKTSKAVIYNTRTCVFNAERDSASQSPREDAYQFISDMRMMNLQADLFLQRQKSLRQSLKVELVALEANDTLLFPDKHTTYI